MKFSFGGDSYPKNQPVFNAVVLKNGFLFKKGQVLQVMESYNKYFKGMWRVNDSEFIDKSSCKLLLP